jgi:phage virion morphogenesis protein
MPEIEGLSQLLDRLGTLAFDTRHVERPLRAVGALLVTSIEKNFAEQGRPQKWTPLAPRTLAGRRRGKGKGGPRILIDTGRLKSSINYKMVSAGGGPAVKVGTNVRYAARQHFGYPGGAGRGHAKTPARPFMLIQPEDVQAIDRVFTRHIARQ